MSVHNNKKGHRHVKSTLYAGGPVLVLELLTTNATAIVTATPTTVTSATVPTTIPAMHPDPQPDPTFPTLPSFTEEPVVVELALGIILVVLDEVLMLGIILAVLDPILVVVEGRVVGTA